MDTENLAALLSTAQLKATAYVEAHDAWAKASRESLKSLGAVLKAWGRPRGYRVTVDRSTDSVLLRLGREGEITVYGVSNRGTFSVHWSRKVPPWNSWETGKTSASIPELPAVLQRVHENIQPRLRFTRDSEGE